MARGALIDSDLADGRAREAQLGSSSPFSRDRRGGRTQERLSSLSWTRAEAIRSLMPSRSILVVQDRQHQLRARFREIETVEASDELAVTRRCSCG